MKTTVKILPALAIALMLAGLFSSCTARYYSAMTTDGKVGSKEGIAKKTLWFGIGFNIDVSQAKAAQNGGITRIATSEHIRLIGPFRHRYITRVTGE